jgi:hypothetical protein
MVAALVLVALSWSLADEDRRPAVFSQEPDQLGGFASDAGTVEVFGVGVEVADDFTLRRAAPVRSVVWYGFYPSAFGPPPATDDFTIAFFADDGGVPAAEPFAQYAVGDGNREDANLPIDGTFVYRANIPKTLFEPNTTYYISIVNDTAGDDGLWFWEQANTGEGGPIFIRLDFSAGFGDWFEDFGDPTDPLGSDYDTAFALSVHSIDDD